MRSNLVLLTNEDYMPWVSYNIIKTSNREQSMFLPVVVESPDSDCNIFFSQHMGENVLFFSLL